MRVRATLLGADSRYVPDASATFGALVGTAVVGALVGGLVSPTLVGERVTAHGP